MTFDFASAVAVEYWHDHGITVPCKPTIYFMSQAQSDYANKAYGMQVDMLTDPVGCTIEMFVAAEIYRTHPDLDWLYCQDITHEFGHLAGLGHDYGGVMDLWSENIVPFGCAHQRQWMFLHGWRQPPRWVRHSPCRVQHLWSDGHDYAARTARRAWLKSPLPRSEACGRSRRAPIN